MEEGTTAGYMSSADLGMEDDDEGQYMLLATYYPGTD